MIVALADEKPHRFVGHFDGGGEVARLTLKLRRLMIAIRLTLPDFAAMTSF